MTAIIVHGGDEPVRQVTLKSCGHHGSAVFGARKLWHGVDVRGRLGQRQDATGSGALHQTVEVFVAVIGKCERVYPALCAV